MIDAQNRLCLVFLSALLVIVPASFHTLAAREATKATSLEESAPPAVSEGQADLDEALRYEDLGRGAPRS